MRIVVGSDHAGFELKDNIVHYLRERGHMVTDAGTGSGASCDYPDFAARAARLVSTGDADRGVLICGTGIGMVITANKFKGVRAALCTTPEEATLARRHNNTNILCLGCRTRPEAINEKILETWLETGFEGGRHQDRLDKIARIEQETFT